jgi:hypothetical protein
MRKTCPNENLIEFLLLTTRISFDSSTTDIVTTDIGTTGIGTTDIGTTVIAIQLISPYN